MDLLMASELTLVVRTPPSSLSPIEVSVQLGLAQTTFSVEVSRQTPPNTDAKGAGLKLSIFEPGPFCCSVSFQAPQGGPATELRLLLTSAALRPIYREL